MRRRISNWGLGLLVAAPLAAAVTAGIGGGAWQAEAVAQSLLGQGDAGLGSGTGEIVRPTLEDPGTTVSPPSAVSTAVELKVPEITDDEDEAAAASATPVPPAVRSATNDRLPQLKACRAFVASRRQKTVDRVPGGRVLLRWTVEPNGVVSNAEAVALEPTDPDVLTCARDRVEGWRYDRQTGPIKVTRRVTLR